MGNPSQYGFSTPEERWSKWETEEAKSKSAVWDIAPGYELIPEIDLPLFHSFFLDGTHSSPPVTPLYGYQWVRNCGIGNKLVNIKLNLPTCYGWEWRYKKVVFMLPFSSSETKRKRERERLSSRKR
ncbi:MAG: hypothetical protein J7M06_06745 [Proteobacteria bacterium]|nr:hypothetical protein [Pseudomonadota bacterium]